MNAIALRASLEHQGKPLAVNLIRMHVRTLPTALAMTAAIVLEWLFMIFTLGNRRPGLLSKQQIKYSCFTHINRIEKAKEKLGYAPVADFEGGICKVMNWSLHYDGW